MSQTAEGETGRKSRTAAVGENLAELYIYRERSFVKEGLSSDPKQA